MFFQGSGAAEDWSKARDVDKNKKETIEVSRPRDEGGGAAWRVFAYGEGRGKMEKRKTEDHNSGRPGESSWGESVPGEAFAVDEIDI